MKHTVLLVDCDMPLYAAACGADRDAKERWGEEAADMDYEHWCFSNINSFFNALSERFPQHTEARVFIGGYDNYRNHIATIKPYKGNRKSANRPKYYEETREYLVSRYGAVKSHGREADDEVSILQYADRGLTTVIVDRDKDLHNTPGWNFNPHTKELKYISKLEADINFLGQVLTGDSVDNIVGVPRLGPVTRDKIIASCNGDVKALKREVDNQYKKAYGRDKWEQALWENATLLWIQRKDWVNWDGSTIQKPALTTTEESTPND